MDLFGPLTFQDPYNKRKTGKARGVVFICTTSSLVHVEMTESNYRDSFVMALRKLMTVHGAPKRFQSSQGDQLVTASKQLATSGSGPRCTSYRCWCSLAQRASRESDWVVIVMPGLILRGEAALHDGDGHFAG